MAPTSDTVTTSLKIAASLHRRVENLASERQQTPASVMSEAIEQYVERREKREQFLEEGVAAWVDYKATGLHITGDEVDEWLNKLDAGEDAELPECHP